MTETTTDVLVPVPTTAVETETEAAQAEAAKTEAAGSEPTGTGAVQAGATETGTAPTEVTQIGAARTEPTGTEAVQAGATDTKTARTEVARTRGARTGPTGKGAAQTMAARTARAGTLRVTEATGAREYNEAASRSPHADVLQSWEWGELKRRTGWQPIRIVLRDDAGGARAAFTLLEKRIPYVGRTFLYAPRGPGIDFDDADVVDATMNAIREAAADRGAIFVKIDPDVPKPRPDVVHRLQAIGYVPARFRPHWGGIQPVAVCRLDLRAEEDELLAAFHHKTRYNIRLASRRGVEVRPGTREDLPKFYNVWQETARRQGFSTRGLDHLHEVWDYLVDADLGTLLLAECEGRVLAGVVATAFGDKAWYLYGATLSEERHRMPMYLLQWEAIRWAKARGCTLYDFLGVSCHMNPAEPIYGLYRFKRGFNTEYTEFIGEFDLPLRPRFYRAWNALEPAYLRTMRQVGRARRGAGRMLEAAGRGGLGPL